MQKINFCETLPREPAWKLSKKRFFQSFNVAILILILLFFFQGSWVGIKASYSLFLNHQIQREKEDIRALTLKRPELNGLIQLSNEETLYTQIYHEKLTLTDILSKRHTSPKIALSTLLKGLSESTIPGVWLTEIQASPANTHLMLKGKALGYPLLNHFIQSLKRNPSFAKFIVQDPVTSPSPKISKELNFSVELTEKVS